MYACLTAKLIISTGGRGSRPHPWIAKLTGLDPVFGFKREFIKGVYDYSYACKSGRDTVVYWFLAPGLYDAYKPTSWKHEKRWFLVVDQQGNITEITKDKVLECLKNTD